ncbi:MAG: hypothetical protein WCY09_02400 [Candidatus Omnitrophota bacterium]
MNKNILKNVVLILLIGITAFSMVKYMSELQARYRLKESLIQAEGQIAVLLQDKQNLLQEIEKEKELEKHLLLKNTGLKDYLGASKKKIMRLFQDKAKTQNSFEELSARLSILKAENKALIDGRKRIYTENEQFKLKLSSVVELKKAIRELKSKKRLALKLEGEGNRGYLIKDGRLTTEERVKIEVVPSQTKE